MSAVECSGAFGGLQFPRCQAKAVLIPVAYDLTASYGAGARNGPAALLAASRQMELFDPRLGLSPIQVGVHTLESLEQIVSGPEAMIASVAEVVGSVLDENRMPILVGGDHSVSNGAFRALAERDRSVTILQFDAHADLRNEYQGSPLSHACVMARARESFDVVQVGIRSYSEEEYQRIREERTAFFPIWQLRNEPASAVDEIRQALGPRVYLTIDLDVLDPSIMPSTGTPEPGGLTWDELIWFLQRTTEGKEVVGFDLMELSPRQDNHAPDFLAAKLLNHVLGITRGSVD